jgi:hypothetical protein
MWQSPKKTNSPPHHHIVKLKLSRAFNISLNGLRIIVTRGLRATVSLIVNRPQAMWRLMTSVNRNACAATTLVVAAFSRDLESVALAPASTDVTMVLCGAAAIAVVVWK